MGLKKLVSEFPSEAHCHLVRAELEFRIIFSLERQIIHVAEFVCCEGGVFLFVHFYFVRVCTRSIGFFTSSVL